MKTENNIHEFTGRLARPPWFYRQWMLAGNPAYFFDRLAKDFGDFVHYRGLFNFYQVNHPALVKQVLMETHKSFDKRNVIYRRFANVFGNGLVVSEGDDWKRQRKLLQPMFGPITVRRFFDSMLRATCETMDRWQVTYADGKVFDIAREMDELTLRNAGEVLFSDGFCKEAKKISQWNETINHYCAKPPLPIIRSFWFPSRLNRRVKKTLAEFHQFISEMIDKRRAGGPQNDLLSILLEAKDDDDGDSLSDLEIREQVLGMILAGHETTASALAWIWYELHQHPEVRKKVDEEIERVLKGELPTVESIDELKYTRMVIDECMRLHPPFWFENRNTIHDVEMGGHLVPQGSLVLFSRYTLQRHPGFWQQPDKLIPERQDPDNPDNARSVYAQVPFGGGPRICIGINFAIMELVLIVATICQRFEVIVAPEDKHLMAAKMTMFPKHGVKVYLKPRNLSVNST